MATSTAPQRNQRGTYILVMHNNSRETTVQVGRLSDLSLKAGLYLYVGSAFIPPQQLVGYWRLRLFNASSPKSVGTTMYNKRQIGAENGELEPLASNQVVGGSNPSGRAIISTTYGALKI